MDQSLDAYMTKKRSKGPSFPKGVRNRLGSKVSPGKAAVVGTNRQQPWANKKPVNVTGLGAVKGFDARQKLANTKPRDARELLQNKTKFTDARVRLESKKAQQLKEQTGTAKNLPGNDMRIKINNAKARQVDARSRIKSRQDARKNPSVPAAVSKPTQVTVAGNKRVLHSGRTLSNVVSAGQGTLLKTVSNARQPETAAGRSFAHATNAIVDHFAHNPQPFNTRPHQSILRGEAAAMPKVQIRNDRYQAPETHQVHINNDYYTAQADQLQSDYHQPQARQIRSDFYQQQQQQQTVQVSSEQYEAPVQESYRPHSYQTQAIPTVVSRAGRGAAPAARQSDDYAQTRPAQQQPMDGADTVSPLQGFRVHITNLHPVVTQEDIVELFGVMGALKKARLVKVGVAEVVYVNRDDAVAAVHKYHMRELDGQPMHAVMKSAAGVPSRPAAQPLRSSTSSGGISSNEAASLEGIVDHSLLHKALFRTNSRSENGATGPVSFTVKI